jgi:alpha-tubulin suppressor-like RCC1 family protein
LLETGELVCWGDNGSGELGTGDTTSLLVPSAPLVFTGGFAPKTLVLGNQHTCAISADSRVKCWGSNQQGQLGPDVAGDLHAPGPDLRVRGRAVLALAAGDDHTCAVLEGGALKCWGRNGVGQLGLGDLANRGEGPGQMGDALAEVALGGAAIAVGAGAAHTCAVTADGGVRCWGVGDAGQLGFESGAGSSSPPVSSLALPAPAVSVVAGADYSCALLATGQAVCWGAGARGQLGAGDTTGGATPGAAISFGAKATALAAGAHHVCALLSNGKLACWGANGSGQLGQGDTADRPRPVSVETGGRPVKGVAAGGDTTCALTDGGAVTCWGANDQGQLGLGDTVPRPAAPIGAVPLGSGRSASAVSVGGTFTCALLDTAQTKCWGDNRAMELGAVLAGTAYGDGPNETGDVLPEVAQGGGRSVGAVVAGRAHTCAVLDTGDVRCWGDNTYGQLGVGDGDLHSAVAHPTGVVDLGRAP